MKQIKFSIIVVCLNAGEKLHKTIESVLRQSYTGFEILIKDGMSTDGSIEALPQEDAIRVVRQKDKGIYDAMNQAILLAEGDYLLFLNCGDYLYDERVLEKVNAWITTDSASSAIYYGNIYNRITHAEVSSNPHINAFACYRNVPCHQACFYARELMRKRPYQIKYRVRADYEQFLGSYFKEGVRPVFMQVTVASYEGGGFSETKENRERSAKEHAEITACYFSKGQLFYYRLLLALTLAPLRTKLSENEHFSEYYNALKKWIYRRRT